MGSHARATYSASRYSALPLRPMQNKIKVSGTQLFSMRHYNDSMPGLHEFSWAVLPHAGHFLQSDVPQAAYLFNSPLHCESR